MTDTPTPLRADCTDRLKVRLHNPDPFPAGELYRSGVRTVELDQPVDLVAPSPADCRGMDIVRLATARGMRVIWEIRSMPPSIGADALSHLHPPRRIQGPDGAEKIAAWWEEFYLGRCCWRQGPGFLQIRDRRSRRLVKYTLTEPDLIAALRELDQGNHGVPAEAIGPLIEEGLVLAMGELFWLAPYRMVRWPFPSMTV
ncbi:DUF5825 family protein [Nonomuraea turcica]|uniref:DUF5825 family protein n=1 Tax=Nonomuraea sp. G32 TaxID=3067274 RepID=UPI00273B8082|nr:DUF5825 family protein [Nonomuraea sp. G32]MDP4501075.1 DUF5825 family protein [Nonomuraea sp. G32]